MPGRRFAVWSATEPMAVTRVRSLAELRMAFERLTPDVILLDLGLPDSSGIDTLTDTRLLAGTVPIVVTTADAEHTGPEAIQHGAQDYVSKVVNDDREVVRALRHAVERGRYHQDVVRAALFDEVTGLASRRHLLERLANTVARSQRTRVPFHFAYLDLTSFKLVNDRFGHTVGDHVLAVVAERLTHRIRAEDTAGRIGGDEFGVILERVDRHSTAQLIMDALLTEVKQPIEVHREVFVTVSFNAGLVRFPGPARSVQQMLAAADAAMYEAKRAGQAVCHYHDLQPSP